MCVVTGYEKSGKKLFYFGLHRISFLTMWMNLRDTRYPKCVGQDQLLLFVLINIRIKKRGCW